MIVAGRALPLLVAALVGCAHESPPSPRPAPQREVPVAVTPRGHLLVRHLRGGLVRCEVDAGCALIPNLPEKLTSVTQSGPGRYVLGTATSSFEYDVERNAIEELAGAGPGVVARLEDGSLLRYDHLASHSRVFRRAPDQNWIALLDYDKLRAYEFRFLGGGLHLFKTSPGMGGPESPYFIDLIVGHPTHLHVVDALGKKPRRVHSSSQQMDADFLDAGRRIAWWQPGDVDDKTNRRTVQLQVLEVASGTVTTIDTVTTPLKTPQGSRRDAPDASSSVRSTWIVHAHDVGPDYAATSLRADDVATGKHVDHALGAEERLLSAIPHDSTWPHRHGRRYSDHVIVARMVGAETELVVLEVPSFTPIHRTVVPTAGLLGADWVETN